MDLSTRYLGLSLPHPFMPGAGPLADDLDTVRRLEDAGAAAIVLRSLFEEQIEAEQLAAAAHIDHPADSFAEATSFFPATSYRLGPEEYLEQLAKVRGMVDLPVIASLNGTREGRWLEYAGLIEEAGAAALELNLLHIATDPEESSAALEERLVGVVGAVAERVELPVAVKLSPYFTAPLHCARELVAAGARGVVCFNRFYGADIDVEALELEPVLRLSDSTELAVRLRWLAVFVDRLPEGISLAVTGGVHTALDAVKAVMAGADGVQLVSALLRRGPAYLETLRSEFSAWLEEHEYASLAEMRGSMSLDRCPDPTAYRRGNYARILQRLPRLDG